MDEHQQNPILVNTCHEFERRILHDKTVRAAQEWLDAASDIEKEFKCKCWLARFKTLDAIGISFNSEMGKDPETIPIYERNHD